jgi:ankyrin repeat protein
VDMPDRSGAVPLMHAARMSNGLGLEILLALGADLHATNESVIMKL